MSPGIHKLWTTTASGPWTKRTKISDFSDEFMRMYMFKKRAAVNDGSMFGQALSDWKNQLGDDLNDHAAEEVFSIPMFSF